MKKKMHRIHEEELNSCIDFIEKGISSGWSYTEVTKGLEYEFNSRYGTLRRIFSDFTPFSINRYIKRRIFTVAYFKLKRERHSPSTRESIYGIDNFVYRFEREFKCEVTGDYSEEDLQPVLDLKLLRIVNSSLCKLPIVESFELRDDVVSIEVDTTNLLKAFLNFTSYLLPSELLEMYESQEDDYKIIFLELVARHISGRPDVIKEDEADILLHSAKLYDFDARKQIGNSYYVFCPEIPEFLHETYLNMCDTLMPFIKTIIPRYRVQFDSEMVVYAISDAESIKEAAYQIGMKKGETKELVWGLLNNGYLRYMAV